MIMKLNDIFKRMNEHSIIKAEIECENGLPCSYQCYFKDNKIIVKFQTRSYSGETLAHWGEHDNDFAENKPYQYSFFEIEATKDDYINMMVYYIERNFHHKQRWGENLINSLHFNLIGDD